MSATVKILRETKYRKSEVNMKGFKIWQRNKKFKGHFSGFKISAEMKKHKSEVQFKGFKI